MDTLTLIEKNRNKVTSWETTITVTRTPATLHEHRMLRHRWFDYVGQHVTACFEVTVRFQGLGSDFTETYFEIVTPFGRGTVIMFRDHSELSCFVPTTGKALIQGCWKKYGKSRGHAVGYARAHGLNVDGKKVDHCCAARIYAAAVGKPYGIA